MANRESRRRKILERGSDRLAFIAGRAPPPSLLHRDPESGSSKPSICEETRLSDQTTVTPIGNDKQDLVVDAGNTSGIDSERSAKLPSTECNTSIETSSAPLLVVNGREQASLISSTDQNSSVSASSREQHLEPALVVNGREQSSLISSTDQNSSVSASSREQHLEPPRGLHKHLTPRQISSAISATERTRLFCSIAVALLVIFSYLGFPLFRSSIIKSILSFTPLYLVLLTDVTVVLARLLFDNREGFQRATRGGINIPSTDGWAQVSNALEVGLMMQKVIDAIFMDCSIYSIIVICGLAFR